MFFDSMSWSKLTDNDGSYDFDIVLSLVDDKTDMQQSMSNPREVLKNKVDSCRLMIEQLLL